MRIWSAACCLQLFNQQLVLLVPLLPQTEILAGRRFIRTRLLSTNAENDVLMNVSG